MNSPPNQTVCGLVLLFCGFTPLWSIKKVGRRMKHCTGWEGTPESRCSSCECLCKNCTVSGSREGDFFRACSSYVQAMVTSGTPLWYIFTCHILFHFAPDFVLVLHSFASNFNKQDLTKQLFFVLSFEESKNSLVDRPCLISLLLVFPGYPRNTNVWCLPHAFHRRGPRYLMKFVCPSTHRSTHPPTPSFCPRKKAWETACLHQLRGETKPVPLSVVPPGF